MSDFQKEAKNRTLFNVKVSEISANPFNPRLIFDYDDLNELKKSIEKVGVLVPITLYRNSKNHPLTPYILLDGERRWRCAKELDMQEIPANVIDEPSDDTQNIMFMFNIHHFRKEWALFPTALKLETVIQKIGTDQESVLSEFTGVSRSMIRRCKTLLWFPKKYRDILMEKGEKISTDFFIELYPIAKKLSNLSKFSYPEGTITLVDGMIEKFKEQKTFSDVKEFREIRRSMGFSVKNQTLDQFEECVSDFISNPTVGLDRFTSSDLENDMTRKNILKYVSYLNSTLNDVDADIISDYTYVSQLQQLNKSICRLLETIE